MSESLQFHVIKTANADYVSVQQPAILADKDNPADIKGTMVLQPIFIFRSEHFVGETVHIVGPFEDLLFTPETFVKYVHAGHFRNLDVSDAIAMVEALKREFLQDS